MWGKKSQAEPELECSLVKAPTVYLESMPRQKITYLMEEYSHQEWLAYLVGELSDKDHIFVKDISVPPHKEATGASAEAEPLYVPKRCVGLIHSHNSFGAFHSGIDQDYVDKNYPVSITVSIAGGNLSFDAVSYSRTLCGKLVLLKCNVKYVQPEPVFSKEAFLREAKANIDKGKQTKFPEVKVYGGDNYLPMRYRLGSTIITDKEGHVLSKTEVEDMLANSTEGE